LTGANAAGAGCNGAAVTLGTGSACAASGGGAANVTTAQTTQ